MNLFICEVGCLSAAFDLMTVTDDVVVHFGLCMHGDDYIMLSI